MFKNKFIASALALSLGLPSFAQEKIDYQKYFKQYANDTISASDPRLKEMSRPKKSLQFKTKS